MISTGTREDLFQDWLMQQALAASTKYLQHVSGPSNAGKRDKEAASLLADVDRYKSALGLYQQFRHEHAM